MANNTFPNDWRDEPCFIVAIPKPLAPFVGGLLKIMEYRGFWASDADFLNGYTATIELEGCLMSTCLNTLFERQNELYRLVNTALFGQLYTVVTDDPLVVTPAIAPAVDLTVLDQDSVMGRLDRLTQLVDNSVNGTETPLYSYTPAVKALLQSIIDAINAGASDNGDILAQLELIATLVA